MANRPLMMVPLSTYASYKPDPGATDTDAMTINWSLLKGHTSSGKCISGLSRSGPSGGPRMAGATFVASPPEPLIKNPVMIPNSNRLLRDPASPLRIH